MSSPEFSSEVGSYFEGSRSRQHIRRRNDLIGSPLSLCEKPTMENITHSWTKEALHKCRNGEFPANLGDNQIATHRIQNSSQVERGDFAFFDRLWFRRSVIL